MSSTEYRVSSGDTLSAIARRFNVTVEVLSQLNGISDVNCIWAGQVLRIPRETPHRRPSPPKPRVHRVCAGETLSQLAQRYNVTVEELVRANTLKNPDRIQIGQVLLIPIATVALTGETPVSVNLQGSIHQPLQDTPNTGESKPPKDVQEARRRFPQLARKNDQEVQKIVDSLIKIASASSTLADRLSAAAAIVAVFSDTLKSTLQKCGVKDQAILKIAGNQDLIDALSDVFDASESIPDRIIAALTLAKELRAAVTSEKLSPALQKMFAGLPAASQLARTVGTLVDPQKSALEKAQAALEFVTAAKSAAGEMFPALANKLRAAGSSLALIDCALTLLSPSASLEDKAIAAVKLLANAGDVGKDLRKMKAWLTERRVPNAGGITDAVGKLPASTILEPELLKQLDPEVAQSLPVPDAHKLAELAADPELEEPLLKLLGAVESPAGVHELLQALSLAAPHSQPEAVKLQKHVIAALSGLEYGVLNEVLSRPVDGGKPAVQSLTELMAKVPESARGPIARLVKEFDEKSLKIFLRLGAAADGKTIGIVVEFLAEKTDSKAVGKALKLSEALIDNLVLKITKEIAGKVLKGLAKMVPVAGAIPAALDAWSNATLALNTRLPPEIRYLASMGAMLNAVDAVLGIIEVLGVTNVDLPIQLALGVAELALDLVITSELAKFTANPRGYRAPGWMDAVIVGTALSSGPKGVVHMMAIFGVEGAERKLISTAAQGGKLAIHAAEYLGTASAQQAGRSLKVTGEMLHVLADMIRYPEKYAAMAVDMAQKAVEVLVSIAEKGWEIATLAWSTLTAVVGELRRLGEKGLKALQWIAQNPGKAAELALRAIQEMLQEAGQAIASAALATLRKLYDFYVDAKGAIRRGFEAAVTATRQAFDKALTFVLQQGKKGLEALRWVINNPGAAAKWVKDKLVAVISAVGQYAQQALQLLVELGETCVEYVKKAILLLKEKAQRGLELIAWVAENPGKAAAQVVKAAVDALKSLANSTVQLAQAARDKLVKFIEGQKQVALEARAAVRELILLGTAAGERILEAWKSNLTEGAKAVIAGFKDLADAGADALRRIVAKGGLLIREGLQYLKSMLRSGVQSALHALDWLARQSREIALQAIDALKNSAPVKFAERVFDTLMSVGSRKDVKDFLRGTEYAFKVVSRAYSTGGLVAVAQLIGRTGVDIGSHLVTTLWEQRHRLTKAIDSLYDFAQAFASYFSVAELEQLLGVDIPLVGN